MDCIDAFGEIHAGPEMYLLSCYASETMMMIIIMMIMMR